jgi:hypothetical protein
MDLNLMNLRQREVETSIEFLKAQRVYLEAADISARKSETELKKAAEGYCKAIEPYEAALKELRQYLLTASPSEAIAMELDRTERLIKALEKEKKVGSNLIVHHAEMITDNIKLTSRHDVEE